MPFSAGQFCRKYVSGGWRHSNYHRPGQHHHVSPHYLHQHANQAAWLKDNRRKGNGTLAYGLVQNAVICQWKGYWERAT